MFCMGLIFKIFAYRQLRTMQNYLLKRGTQEIEMLEGRRILPLFVGEPGPPEKILS